MINENNKLIIHIHYHCVDGAKNASAAVTSTFYSVLVHNRTSLSHHSDDRRTKHLKRCTFYTHIYNRNCVHTLICFINNSTPNALSINPSFLASRRFYHHQTFLFEAENHPTHIPYTCVYTQIYYVSDNTTHIPRRLTIDPIITSCCGKAPRTALDVSFKFQVPVSYCNTF